MCDAMRCRLDDGDDSAEPWTDFAGRELAPDRFWNSAMDEMISADNEGPYMGARQGGYFFQTYILHVHYDYYINQFMFTSFVV